MPSAGRLGVPERHLARPAHPGGDRRWPAHLPALGLGRCAIAAGLTDQVMSHDEGWHFLAVGRALERADMTIRLIAAADLRDRIGAAVARPGQCLRRVGALCPGARRVIGQRTAIEFALLDRKFPRSVLRCLTAAEVSLAELEAAGSMQQRDPRRDPSSATPHRRPHQDRPGLPHRHRTGRRPAAPASSPAADGGQRPRGDQQLLLPPR